MFGKKNALAPAILGQSRQAMAPRRSVSSLNHETDLFDALVGYCEAEVRAIDATATAKVKKDLAPELIEALRTEKAAEIEAARIRALRRIFQNETELDALNQEIARYNYAKSVGMSTEEVDIIFNRSKARSEY